MEVILYSRVSAINIQWEIPVVTLSGEDQQAIAKLQNRHKPPILLHGLLYQMVASPLHTQQALVKEINSIRGW